MQPVRAKDIAIKIFRSTGIKLLENKVNGWLQEFDGDVIDIRYDTCDEGTAVRQSVVIIYKKYEVSTEPPKSSHSIRF